MNWDIWNILGTIAVVLFTISFWSGRNAVWGGLTSGLIVGLLISTYGLVGGTGFSWSIVGKSAIVGVLFGLGAEMLSMLSKYLRRN